MVIPDRSNTCGNIYTVCSAERIVPAGKDIAFSERRTVYSHRCGNKFRLCTFTNQRQDKRIFYPCTGGGFSAAVSYRRSLSQTQRRQDKRLHSEALQDTDIPCFQGTRACACLLYVEMSEIAKKN